MDKELQKQINKAIATLKKLDNLDNFEIVKESQNTVASAKDNLSLPLSERLSPTREGADARRRLEEAQYGQVSEHADNEDLDAVEDEIMETLADDTISKLIGDLFQE